MLAVVESAAIFGVEAYGVRAEVNVSGTVPSFTIVGLPDAAVQESRERVRAAIRNSGLRFPYDKRIIVNLAPADIRKAGPSFDLPIALGLLVATEQLPADVLEGTVFIGELGLDGAVRPVSGILPLALWARQSGRHRLIVPEANTREAAIVGQVEVFGVTSLAQVLEILCDPSAFTPVCESPEAMLRQSRHSAVDFADVKGQAQAKRALEVAAAGGHNILLIGSPGTGKTMLARRLPTILPALTVEEALEVTKLYSVAGQLANGAALVTERPFRAPHHTISNAGLTGGGAIPRPGEMSLAHFGVLFLDELPEYNRDVLEVMRQPLEEGQVTIARAAASLTYPARFALVAALNPCECGYFGDPLRACTCTPQKVARYQNRVSGPLLDRLDIHLEVPRLLHDELTAPPAGENSATIRTRVEQARERQRLRFNNDLPGVMDGHAFPDHKICPNRPATILCNAHMTPRQIQRHCTLAPEARTLLSSAITAMQLSARAYDRILKVARTIADLGGEDVIGIAHIAEAVQYRSLDRKFWR